MFKISPISDINEQKKIAKACASEYKDGFFGYKMVDNDSGEIMGFSQFEITADGGYISDIKERIGYTDFEAMFILIRQTMNFINICGADHCTTDQNAGDEKLIKMAGFKLSSNGVYSCMLEGMFDGHCSGESVKL